VLGNHCVALSMPQVLFALVILEIGSCFLPRPAWTMFLLFYAFCSSWNDRHAPPHLAFFPIEMGISQTFLSGLAWNHNPPNLSLLHSLRWQVHATVPSCWLRWGLANFFPSCPRTIILPTSLSLPNS
jgi:hypothetical protein